MTIRSEEIRARLAEFASRWSVYDRSERAEAQTFLNELFDCYGTRRPDVATFEEPQSGKFLDCIWPRNCIIEMKAPAEAKRLAKHRTQALDYWRNSADPATSTPAPRYVVLCAFRTLEVWEPGAYPNEPCAVLDLVELPERYETLLFLTGEGEEAVFTGSQQQVTREAVGKVSELFHLLADRSAASEGELQDFLLQSVWCMFAEDLAMIPAKGFTRLLEDLIASPRRSSADDLGRMFELLNSPPSIARHGLYKDVPYANGGLFAEPAHVHLDRDELRLLLDAARDYRWNEVEPSIFGSLLEGGLGRDQQWALGAHYTHEVDIQKVVQPTIVRPWRERIENCTTLKQATDARRDLSQYVVLDPACGSGNFLYVAYRELRRIERDLNERIAELERHAGRTVPEGMTMGSFPLANMRGIELEGFAVKLARVTLWMGHKLAIDEVGLAEDPLPLADLSGIRRGDALRVDWPKADAIIGNPPFHGTKDIRSKLGDEYTAWLDRHFGIGVKDLCTYWFRRAVEEMPDGGRAGLVATNSVREGKNREVTLDYIEDSGQTLVDAVSTQTWLGDANVFVSIVNWIGRDVPRPEQLFLDGAEVEHLSTSLSTSPSLRKAVPLARNSGKQFFGVVQSGDGFTISSGEARALLDRTDIEYGEVVRPRLIGEDIAQQPGAVPSTWIVDFQEMPLEDAERYPLALEIVRKRVKPDRDKHPKPRERNEWWKFSRTVRDLFAAVKSLDRFIACPATSKRKYMVWCDKSWVPTNATSVFAFDDWYSFGVLESSAHKTWSESVSTKLKSDPRYTSRSFSTFAWPISSLSHRNEIASIAEELVHVRERICDEQRLGLTSLYNALDEGAFAELEVLHRRLDEQVVTAYGWPASIAQDADETNRRLLELNQKIAGGEIAYDPFSATPAVSAT